MKEVIVYVWSGDESPSLLLVINSCKNLLRGLPFQIWRLDLEAQGYL